MLAGRSEGLSTAMIYSWMCSQELLKWFPLKCLEKEAAGSAPDTPKLQNTKEATDFISENVSAK